MKMKDGTEVSDPRLGRLITFDKRSLAFKVSDLKLPSYYRTKNWVVRWVLDQGNSSTCVGNAWIGEALAEPVSVPNLDEVAAVDVYDSAQQIDEWPGENYEGTSVIAGAKVMQSNGYFDSYHWATSPEDAVRSICWTGPGVFGLNWHNDMFEPDANYFLTCTGDVAGGHAILAYGVQCGADDLPQYVLVKNSWGPYWGRYGSAKIRIADFKKLMADAGEFCVPVGRKTP